MCCFLLRSNSLTFTFLILWMVNHPSSWASYGPSSYSIMWVYSVLLSIFLFSFSTHRDKTSIHYHIVMIFKPFTQSLSATAWKVQHKLCVTGVVRLRSWPAASRSAPVSPPWSLWPVWTLAPACRAARPAAVLFLPAARRYTTDSECLPRRPCCSGSGNSATSKTGSTEWCYWANIHPLYVCCAGLTEGCHVDTSACQSLRKSSHGAAPLWGAKCVMLGGKYPHTGTSWFCPGLGWRPEPDHSLTVWAEGVFLCRFDLCCINVWVWKQTLFHSSTDY